MKYSLFLVEDEKCSLKYLGATTLWDKFVKGKYKGSGTEWVKHLKKCSCPHDRVFLLHATNDYEIHKRVALECSNKWNVSDNPLFLNTNTELGVPEVLDDELHEFRQKIGYRDYDKLVKNQMDSDIKMYTSKGTVGKTGRDIYDRSTAVALDSIKDMEGEYTEEDKIHAEIVLNTIQKGILPKISQDIFPKFKHMDSIYTLWQLYYIEEYTHVEILKKYPSLLEGANTAQSLWAASGKGIKFLKNYLINQQEWKERKILLDMK